MFTYTQMTDNELLILLAQDDELAFKVIYNRYAGYLYRAATARLKDDIAAEDMVQEVFVKLYSNRGKLSGVENLKAWLNTCLRNIILNELRNDHIHQLHHKVIAEQLPVGEQLYHDYDMHVLQGHFNRALLQLSERSREVFLMSRREYLNNKVIADKLQVSVKAVEKHITAALKLLRKELISKMNLLLIIICAFIFPK